MQKSLSVTFATFLLLLLPNISEACRPRYYTNEQRVANASAIFVGQVTGVRQDDVERMLESGDGSITIGGDETAYTLRVYVKRTLKGKTKQIVSPAISSCGNGGASLGDSVVVFINAGGWAYVSTDKEMLASVEKILGK